METVSIDKEKVLALYKKSNAANKKALEEVFTKSYFIGKITDRVKTFQDACAELGLKPSDNLIGYVDVASSKDLFSIEAYARLIIIIRALNEGWVPDWTDSNQTKYYPWFDMRAAPSGSGLSFDGDGRTYTFSDVGSRLCYQTDDIAAYAGEQFLDLYADYFLIAE